MKMTIKTCSLCNNIFVKKSTQRARKYCSETCQQLAKKSKKNLTSRVCARCGIDYKPSHSKQEYCGRNCKNQTRKYTTAEFIQKANKLHKNSYEYSKTTYESADKKVIITCPKHGDFLQTPRKHLARQGCNECANLLRAKRATTASKNKNIKAKNQFKSRAKSIHKNSYEYISEYKHSEHPVKIKCNMCLKIFSQSPLVHLRGSGCPYCKQSKGEKLIANWLELNDIDFEIQKGFDGCIGCKYPLKFDFWLPEKNIVIEYQGEQHYMVVSFGSKKSKQILEKELVKRKTRDGIKKQYCLDNGIGFIEIPYTKISSIHNILSNMLK